MMVPKWREYIFVIEQESDLMWESIPHHIVDPVFIVEFDERFEEGPEGPDS